MNLELENEFKKIEKILPTHDIKLFSGRSNSVLAQEIADYLRTHADSIIDLHDIIRFGTEVRESEDGEKEGNIVPWVELPRFLDSSINELNLSNYTKGNEKEIEAIAKQCLVHLQRSNELDIVKECVAYAVAISFIKEISEYLRLYPNDIVEIGSLIKFRVVIKTDEEGKTEYIPIAELGELFKLGVKNDDETEEDDNDIDDD